MLRSIFLVVCFFASLHAGEKLQLIANAGGRLPGQEDLSRGRNVSNLPGTVDLLTGTFSEEQVDLFSKGPEPLLLARVWKNGGYSGGNFGGWGLNNYHKSQRSIVGQYHYQLICEPYGMALAFGAYGLGFPRIENFRDGFVNTSLGEICGSTTAKSLHAHMEGALLVVIDPDGTRRVMQERSPATYFSIAEERPHSREIRYEWQGELISSFFSRGSSSQREFSRVSILPENDRTIVAKSGSREVTYTFTPWAGNKMLLTEIRGGNAAACIKYSYSEDGERLIRREAPQGRYTNIIYQKDNKVSRIETPSGIDEAPITTTQYSYSETRGRKDNVLKGGHTDVIDAYGNVKRYCWDGTRRIRKIATFEGSSKIVTSENIVWNRAYETKDVGDLVCRYIVDETTHSCVYAKSIGYDGAHNPIAEASWGQITGESPGITHVNESKGIVQGECHIRHTSYSQNAYHLLLEEVMRPGHKTVYTYLPNSDLISGKFELVNGEICRRSFFEYGQDGLLVKKIFDDGRSQNPQDLEGVTERHITRIKICQEPLGFGQPEFIQEFYLDNGMERLKSAISYTYTANNLKASETYFDADMACLYTLIYAYDERDRLTKETDKLGVTHTFAYDDNNNCIFEQHRPDVYIEKQYDLMNRLVISREVHSNGQIFTSRNEWDLRGFLKKEYDGLGRAKEYEYDVFGNITQVTEGEAIIKRTYDPLGNVIEETDPDGSTTHKKWNIYKKLLEITYPDGSQEKFFYALHGALKKTVNKNGSYLEFTRDPLDRIIKEQLFSKEGKLLTTRQFTYNALHLLEEKDPSGIVTRYTYDKAGRVVTRIKDAGGLAAKMTFTYDALGEVASTTTYYDQNHFFTEFVVRGGIGQTVEERLEDDQGDIQKKVCYQYDTYGRRNLVREFASRDSFSDTYTEYNSRGEISLIINPEGWQTEITHKFILCGECYILEKSTVDPLGNILIATFDEHDRLSKQQRFNAAGELRSLEEIFYTPSGMRSKVVEHVFAQGKEMRTYTVAWTYNCMKKVVEEVRNGLQKTTFSYDPSGQIREKCCPNKTIVQYEYDDLGYLMLMSAPHISYFYEYNERGDITSVKNRLTNTSTTRKYNALGYLQEEILENGLKISFSTDLIGRKTASIFPDGSSAEYLYSGYFLSSIKKDNYYQKASRRNWRGQVEETEGLGSIKKQYDAMHRVSSISSAHWSQDNISFDKAGNFLGCTIHNDQGSQAYTFQYDDLYQITYEQSTITRHYAHDSLYNRIEVDGKPQIINDLNELLDDGQYKYSWDANGNLHSSENCSYSYDALDRLTGVTRDIEASYSYDPFNRRLSKTVNGQITLFFYDGQNEIGSYENGKLKDLRILGDGLGAEIGSSWAMEISREVYFPIHDNRGNVVALQDSSGNVVDYYSYSSFGEESRPGLSPWRFSSKRVDEETGFVYFGRRYYSPSMGRWTTADPQGFQDGFNVYAFLKNNPLNSFDAYGLFGSPTEFFNRADRMISGMLRNMVNSWFAQTTLKHLKSISNALKTASYGLKKMVNALGTGIEFLGKHAIPLPYINKVVESIGSYLSGREKHYEPTESQIRPLNADAKDKSARIIYVNGINTSFFEAHAQAQAIADKTGMYTTLVYNGTHGTFFDVCECVANFFGVPTAPARLLQETLQRDARAVGPNGSVHLFAHSQGGIITHASTSRMKDESINSRIHINTFGSGKMIQKGSFGSVTNHISSKDPIPWFGDPIGRFIAGRDNSGSFVIHKSRNNSMSAHSIDGDVYGKYLNIHLEYLKTLYDSL